MLTKLAKREVIFHLKVLNNVNTKKDVGVSAASASFYFSLSNSHSTPPPLQNVSWLVPSRELGTKLKKKAHNPPGFVNTITGRGVSSVLRLFNAHQLVSEE